MPADNQDYSALEIVRLLEVFGPAYRRFVGQLLPEGESPARLRLLAALEEHGPLTMSAMRAIIGGTAQNVTGLVDALESDGALLRMPHPDDRRKTLIKLSDKTAVEVRRRRSAHQRRIAKLFDHLTPHQRQQFARSLSAIVDHLEV